MPQSAVTEDAKPQERHSRSGALVAKKSLVEAIDPAILSSRSIPGISREAISYLNQYVRAETVLFAVRETDQLAVLAAVSPQVERLSGSKHRITGTLAALLDTEKTMINTPYVQTDLAVHPGDTLTASLVEMGASSLLMVKVEDIGALILAKHDLTSFTSFDEAGTASVALELGYILNGINEVSGWKSRTARLEQELRVANSAYLEADAADGIRSVLAAAVETSEADTGSFLIFDEGSESLVLMATAGQSTETPELRIALGEGITGWVGLHQKAICVQDSDARHIGGSGLLSGHVETAFSIPVTLGDRLIGVMNLGTSVKSHEMSKESLSQTTKILALLGLRVLFAESRHKLNRSLHNTSKALAAAIESRNTFNTGHAAQVSKHAVSLAARLGLPKAQVGVVGLAGVLHDIGVAGMSEDLLGKERSLSSSERSLVSEHPGLGADMLGGIKELKEALPFIRHHHENYDGTGYGEGLAGEDIPLGARILAIAEAFSGMTSKRPHRPAMPKVGALGQLVAGSGTQFDPRLVRVFFEILSGEQSQ